ncbi:CCA tRNA nucleotidyltransferase 1, mitochondrial isoform X2 [Lycorma delicatula]|uniref:CCA tRNA nucleotidyltransferase 1, mitochondrial isoform X2 n=1 Tax=Lycorma delicatula TaxID=130591 RepID=UPI003F517810
MFSIRCSVGFIFKRSINNVLYESRFAHLPTVNISTCLNKSLQQKSCIVNSNNSCKNINSNKDPFMMKLDTPEFTSLFTQALCQLASLFKENSYEIRIAGGAVRDLLLGTKPKDIDFATTATPDQMKAMFVQNRIKMINNKGEKHGTITARINDENFEVTTLRIDVETDGRHAEVEFTTDWRLDANRRDLTVNSMFLGLDGTLYDYFNGYEDLLQKKIVFVGDPAKRIREDYLRILRYFRFYGRISEKPSNYDPECLRVIQENNAGLGKISGERIWLELQKIAVGNYVSDILKTMHKVGLFPFIGLPKSPDINEFDTVLEKTKNLKVHPITIIVPLLKDIEEMLAFHTRCKLSSYERDLGIFIIGNRKGKTGSLLEYQKMILYTKAKTQDAREWVIQLLKYKSEVNFIHEIQSWIVPKFPVSGNLLFEKGVPGGRRMGLVIDHLKLLWIDSEFKLSTEELISHLPEILEELRIKQEEKKKN